MSAQRPRAALAQQEPGSARGSLQLAGKSNVSPALYNITAARWQNKDLNLPRTEGADKP